MTIGKGFKDIQNNPYYKMFASKDNKIAIYKIQVILGANSSQCGLNLKNYSKALTFGLKALKRVQEAKELFNKEDFENHYLALDKKVIYRIGEAKNNLQPLFHMVRYSDQPVDGLRVGTVITACDSIGGDIFTRSKVQLYEYERGGVSQFFSY